MAERVGVLGATSLVGECLLSLLCRSGYEVSAFSRNLRFPSADGVSWHCTGEAEWPRSDLWICAAPIWVLPDYFDRLQTLGVKRLVVLSSTSRFTKDDSSDAAEKEVAARLAEGEARLQSWAERNGVEWVVLRPTLIYGRGRDKNIAEIARFIRRFGFFPVFGKAAGLRQPIHVEDVASTCIAALKGPEVNRAYDISGGEMLPYREMIGRVFDSLSRRQRLVMIPLAAFRLAVMCLRLFPRYRTWSTAMAERMNRDLVFDHSEAARDLNFYPGKFRISRDDLPE